MNQFENADLKLRGVVYDGVAPVQAEGTIDGFSFYFRARHDEWTFAISENSEIDPVDIQTAEAGEQFGYFASEQFGTLFNYVASYMSEDVVKDIIQRCVFDYLKSKLKS